MVVTTMVVVDVVCGAATAVQVAVDVDAQGTRDVLTLLHDGSDVVEVNDVVLEIDEANVVVLV